MTGYATKFMSWIRYASRFTTNRQLEWWKNRKIDWMKSYSETFNHPHRGFIIDKLKTLKWVSVVEMGCASAPNLIRIVNEFPRADVGGIDPNEDAIATANAIFKTNKRAAWFKVGYGENIMMSDNSADVVLSDMTLIYVGRRKIIKYLEEMKRVSRKYVMMLEFHHRNPFVRFWMKLKTGYNVHDYVRLIDKCGFSDVQIDKLPPELWDNGEPQKTFAYLVTARK
jgi:ubiquinone/menaquinone biosynthesis C-methylase UbiE